MSRLHGIFLLVFAGLVTFQSCSSNNSNAESENAESVSFLDETTQKIYNLADKGKLKELFPYLRSEESNYRLLAVQGIANMQDSLPATVDSLVKVLRKDPNAQVREAAAFAIGMTKQNKADSLLAGSFKNEKSRKVQAAILEAVGRTGNDKSLAFIAAVKTYEPNDSVLLIAQARSIFRFFERKITLPAATATMMNFVLNPSAPRQARVAAAYYFGRAKQLSLIANEDTLSKIIPIEKDAAVRKFMTSALARTSGKKAYATMLSMLNSEKDPRVKINVVNNLYPSFGAKLVGDTLISVLADPSIAVATAAAEQIKQFGNPKHIPILLEKAKVETRWQVAVAEYAGALSLTTLKFKPNLEEVSKILQDRFLATKDEYEKAAILDALTGYCTNWSFIKNNALKENASFLLKTKGVESIAKIRKSKTYRYTFPKNLRAVTFSIDSLMKVAVGSGDVGMAIAAAEAMRDSASDYKQFIPVTVIEEGLKKLKLPRDIEGVNSLQKTINYFKGQQLDLKKELPRYNHSIDWQALSEKNTAATITTSKGTIEVVLFAQEAPGSVCNFVKLAGSDFFNNKFFHRVVPGFVIQGGCPRGDGNGAQDFTIRTETPYNMHYDDAGWLGMASSGKDTEGTQWFITSAPAIHLDGRYSIFGKVTKGLDIVQKIEVGDKIISVKVR